MKKHLENLQKDIDIINDAIILKESEYKILKQKSFKLKVRSRNLAKELKYLEKSKIFILTVAKQHKEKIKEYIETIVTNTLQSVYGNEFSFKIDIQQKRDQEEIYFYLETKDGTLLEPRKDTVAGGILDILSLGLKIANWSLTPGSYPLLLFDEPMKNLGSLIYLGGEVLKELTKEFNIQTLLITHEEEFMNIANKVFKLEES
jgi:DNA repair ATPase RecN